MSVMLSAASCLDWAAKLTGLASVPALIAAAQTADESAGPVWFLPYPSANARRSTTPQAKGVFFGLTHQHGPAELARAVLEGWAMRWRMVWTWCTPAASSRRASRLSAAGRAALTGGKCWRISAACSSITVPGAMLALALGAARLAQLAVHDEADRPGC